MKAEHSRRISRHKSLCNLEKLFYTSLNTEEYRHSLGYLAVLDMAHLYLRLADRVVGVAPRGGGNPNHQGLLPITPCSAIGPTAKPSSAIWRTPARNNIAPTGAIFESNNIQILLRQTVPVDRELLRNTGYNV